ncbi:MAG: inosine monophosphate cyclohydrolase [Provencibacterium sp.]|jgi:IMP cyclohydrolase|nr:inosine monophosphate cyclohydrolase [Provencibacterium sp.]
MENVFDLLRQNDYPGRGILLGRSADGEHAVAAYFIMGRSENSCNRIFVPEGDGLRTQAYDPSKLQDPSLVIYAPVRVLGERTIVTNGDQTDTIYEALSQGGSFEDALRTRTFEPDPPIYTPRISGLLEQNGDYRLSILKSGEGDPSRTCRFFYEYQNPQAGTGHLIHVYERDGNPPASFSGEPVPVSFTGEIESFTHALWESLDEQKKISLFVRFIRLQDGRAETRIVNKHS